MSPYKKTILQIIYASGGAILFQTLIERIGEKLNNQEYAPHQDVRELRRDGYITTEDMQEWLNPQKTIAITDKGSDALLPWWQQNALWNKLRNPAALFIGLATIVSAFVSVISYLYPRH